MPNTYNSNTLLQTYRDDWNEDSAFHKILFNAGRALQARELNQLQTIIQAELTRFGRNIFKEGSAVDAGLLEVDNNYRFVQATGVDIDEVLVGQELVGVTSGVTARVIQNVSLGANSARLYVRYTSSGSATPGTTEVTFTLGESITSAGNTYTVGSNSTDIGAGVRIIVDSGNFFAAGRFVHAPKQELILSETTRVYNGTIGFQLIQDVYTVNDSQSLYDNTGDIPNVAAPGADRWRIRLVLVDKANITVADDAFIFLCRIVNSKIVEQVDELDSYNTINDMIARRTYEESGNYIAEPFQLTFEDDNSEDSDIFAIVGPGLAYVRGYRVENDYPKKLKIKRPQAIDTVQTDFIAVEYGAYVLATAATFDDFATSAGETKVDLKTAAGGGGSTIGTAFVKHTAKHYDPDTGVYSTSLFRVYLDNIELNEVSPGVLEDFNQVLSLNHSSGHINLSQSRLFESNKSTNLFPTPRPRPQGFQDYEFTFQKSYTSVTNNVQKAGALGSNQAFTDTTLWLVFDASGNYVPNATVSTTGSAFTVTNAPAGNLTVISYVSQNTAQRREKSLTTGTTTGTLNGDGLLLLDDGGTIYDVYDLISVVDATSGATVTDAFYVDGGQRDTHYEQAKIIKKPGASVTATNITATFRYFNWSNDIFDGGNGYYFDVQSYTNIGYTQIPDYKMNDGTVVSLRDFVDFRGKKTASNFITTSAPKIGEPIQVTGNYYLSRADKLIATEDGQFQILMGQQAENPLFAKTPDNALELYKIVMNPNTISPEDINTTFIEHKRYTMADIAKLERKLDAMDERYTLSLAELEAKLDTKYDSATGQPQNPTSRQTDDGTDQTRTYPNHPDHCASLDPENHLIRPCYDGDNVRLVYRPDDGLGSVYTSKNILVKGDNAYVNHTETPWISQTLASQSISINPNAKVDYIGDLELSPSSDEWKSGQVGTHAVPGATRLDKKEALLWNSWQWNWGGRAIEDLQVDESLMTRYGRAGLVKKPRVQSMRARRRLGGTGGHVSRVVSSETIRNSNSQNRVVDVAVIPWIRSRKIYFRATGLKPFTKFIPFFDGVNVGAWCKQETFVRWSGRDDDLGNQGQNYTGHPDTASELVTDDKGQVEGSFFIPNQQPRSNSVPIGVPTLVSNTPLRFKAGIKEFKLLDINTPNHNNAGSYAIGTYVALGMVDHRKDGMTTTRNPKKIKLIESKIKRPYNASEMKDYLNSLTSGDVNLIEPHLSGSWGGDFSGEIVNFAGIDLSNVLSDYINVDENSAAGVSGASPDQDVSYPFAQSFTVDNQFGVVLTKIDLYFEQVDASLPVSIEIRNMVNGKPGNMQVPGSAVTEKPTSPGDVSNDATTAFTFTFDEPVYLDPGREYALVVKTQSPNYKIWIAKAGEYVVGSTNLTVSTQAANGQLFLPHTGTGATSKELDLSFVAHRAVFDTNATIVFRNAVLPYKLLPENPIILNNNSSIAYIKHECHGLDSAEDVVISGLAAGSYGGIAHTVFNATHTVVDRDAHGFTIDLGSNSNATGEFGGDDVLSSRNMQFIIANPQIETVIPNSTSVDIGARFTTGRSVGMNSGGEVKFRKMDQYVRIAPDQNYELDAPHLVAQRSVETDNTIPNGPASSGGFSLDVKMDLKSPNDYVAPIVDLQRASMTLVQNCISTGYYINKVEESEPYGSSSNAQHHTAPVETAEPSTNIEVKLDANIPPEANLDVWYRAVMTGQNILDQNWIPLPSTTPVIKDADPSVLHRSIYEVKNIPKFTQSQVKLTMATTGMAKIPQIGLVDIGTFL